MDSDAERDRQQGAGMEGATGGESETYRYSVASIKVKTLEEELYELTELSGVPLDKEMFRVIFELLKLNIAPSAILQVLKTLRSQATNSTLPPSLHTSRASSRSHSPPHPSHRHPHSSHPHPSHTHTSKSEASGSPLLQPTDATKLIDSKKSHHKRPKHPSHLTHHPSPPQTETEKQPKKHRQISEKKKEDRKGQRSTARGSSSEKPRSLSKGEKK